MESLLTTEEVAEFLRVDVVTVRRLITKGVLSAYRVGSEFRFAHADIEEFLRRQRTLGGETGLELTHQFAQLTPRVQHVLRLAQKEAQRFQCNYIGTEHMLLSLINEQESSAVHVLQILQVEPKTIRKQVEHILSRNTVKMMDEPGLTPRAKKVVEFARDEARLLNHLYVSTEHLLLGLVREEGGIASGVLESLGVNLVKTREIIKELVNFKTGLPFATEQMVPPQVPPEAATLVPDGTVATICSVCSAPNLPYFQYCFNCSAWVSTIYGYGK